MPDLSGKTIPGTRPPSTSVARPWGTFRQYAHNQEVTVSLLTVEPHQRLSLQSHAGRAELWVALDEGAQIQVEDRVYHPRPGEELWIPAGAKHRLASLGRRVRVLEVAFGDWRQEDITRYEDDYQRPAHGE